MTLRKTLGSEMEEINNRNDLSCVWKDNTQKLLQPHPSQSLYSILTEENTPLTWDIREPKDTSIINTPPPPSIVLSTHSAMKQKLEDRESLSHFFRKGKNDNIFIYPLFEKSNVTLYKIFDLIDPCLRT